MHYPSPVITPIDYAHPLHKQAQGGPGTPQHKRDLIAWIDRLKLRLWVIEDEQRERWPFFDTRVHGPKMCASALAQGSMILHILDGDESKKAPLAGLVGVASEENRKAVYQFDFYGRMSTLLMFEFAIDNMMSQLLAGLGKNIPNNIPNKATTLLKAVGVRDIKSKVDRLYVPYLIRNSLHNIGVHTKSDSTILVHGYPFRFMKGEQVTQWSWQELLWAFAAQWDILSEVLDSQVLSAVKLIQEPALVREPQQSQAYPPR